MHAKPEKIEVLTPVEPGEVPDGVYPGQWTGYEATALIDGRVHRFSLDTALRGVAGCLVKSSAGQVEIIPNANVPESSFYRAAPGFWNQPTQPLDREHQPAPRPSQPARES